MKVEKLDAPANAPLERIYVASAILYSFKGRPNVEIQIFRTGFPDNEIESLYGKNLIAAPDPRMPRQLVAQASETAALRCLLEAFDEKEIGQICKYLKERYADQIEVLRIAPMDLPAPFGIAPLGDLPEGEKSGFINFDRAPGYPLPFKMKAWYDLEDIQEK